MPDIKPDLSAANDRLKALGKRLHIEQCGNRLPVVGALPMKKVKLSRNPSIGLYSGGMIGGGMAIQVIFNNSPTFLDHVVEKGLGHYG